MIRGLHRAVVGVGVAGTGDALWVQVEAADDTAAPSARARELAREYRAVIESIVESRGVPQVAEFLRGIERPRRRSPTPAGYSPDLSFEQKIEVLEALDVEDRLELVSAWAQGDAGRDRAEGQDPHRRQRGHGEAPARVPAARADERDPQGARRGRRRRRGRGVPRRRSSRPACPRTSATQAERELGRLERTSEQSPEYGWIRDVPRLDDRAAVERAQPRTPSTSPRRAACWTPTTTASRT